MLSNLVGLCELARATGDRSYLQPRGQRLGRHRGPPSLPHRHRQLGRALPRRLRPARTSHGANVGETCVTVTWIQLNAQLLRLTGEARYGDELERSYYNHLAAAQRPDGAQWCYYTVAGRDETLRPGHQLLRLQRPARHGAGAHLRLLSATASAGQDGLAVNLFETSRATTILGGRKVTVEQQTDFPRERRRDAHHSPRPAGHLRPARPGRPPGPPGIRARCRAAQSRPGRGSGSTLPARAWKDGDTHQQSASP